MNPHSKWWPPLEGLGKSYTHNVPMFAQGTNLDPTVSETCIRATHACLR